PGARRCTSRRSRPAALPASRRERPEVRKSYFFLPPLLPGLPGPVPGSSLFGGSPGGWPSTPLPTPLLPLLPPFPELPLPPDPPLELPLPVFPPPSGFGGCLPLHSPPSSGGGGGRRCLSSLPPRGPWGGGGGPPPPGLPWAQAP